MSLSVYNMSMSQRAVREEIDWVMDVKTTLQDEITRFELAHEVAQRAYAKADEALSLAWREEEKTSRRRASGLSDEHKLALDQIARAQKRLFSAYDALTLAELRLDDLRSPVEFERRIQIAREERQKAKVRREQMAAARAARKKEGNFHKQMVSTRMKDPEFREEYERTRAEEDSVRPRTESEGCSVHPLYRGLRRPRNECEGCMAFYETNRSRGLRETRQRATT